MKMTKHDIEGRIIDAITTNIDMFLWSEKWLRNDRRWFTCEEIVEKIGMPDPMLFLYALTRLSFDRLEIDGERLRHA